MKNRILPFAPLALLLLVGCGQPEKPPAKLPPSVDLETASEAELEEPSDMNQGSPEW